MSELKNYGGKSRLKDTLSDDLYTGCCYQSLYWVPKDVMKADCCSMNKFKSTGNCSAISRRYWYGKMVSTAYGRTVTHHGRGDKRGGYMGKRTGGDTKTRDRRG